ncbi:MAG: PadR family transcriptional regulator [Gammaproteobacteria bacterium]
MALDHILLGMLRTPASGYDLRTGFAQSIAHFWAAELSQIYPTLKRLEARGLLTSTIQPSDRGPPRKVYALTDDGRKELRDWLQTSPRVDTERVEWLAKVWFMDELADLDRALAFLTALRHELAMEVAALEHIERQWRAEDPRYPDALPDDAFFPQLTLALGLRKGRARIEWADECIVRIKKRSKGKKK